MLLLCLATYLATTFAQSVDLIDGFSYIIPWINQYPSKPETDAAWNLFTDSEMLEEIGVDFNFVESTAQEVSNSVSTYPDDDDRRRLGLFEGTAKKLRQFYETIINKGTQRKAPIDKAFNYFSKRILQKSNDLIYQSKSNITKKHISINLRLQLYAAIDNNHTNRIEKFWDEIVTFDKKTNGILIGRNAFCRIPIHIPDNYVKDYYPLHNTCSRVHFQLLRIDSNRFLVLDFASILGTHIVRGQWNYAGKTYESEYEKHYKMYTANQIPADKPRFTGMDYVIEPVNGGKKSVYVKFGNFMLKITNVRNRKVSFASEKNE